MVEPLRHRQTKEAETDMSDLQPPRHISTLPRGEVGRIQWHVRLDLESGPIARHRFGDDNRSLESTICTTFVAIPRDLIKTFRLVAGLTFHITHRARAKHAACSAI